MSLPKDSCLLLQGRPFLAEHQRDKGARRGFQPVTIQGEESEMVGFSRSSQHVHIITSHLTRSNIQQCVSIRANQGQSRQTPLTIAEPFDLIMNCQLHTFT